MTIQEHFRKSKTIDKFFKDQFPDFNSYVNQGFREQGQTRGRPQGGIAQLSRTTVAIRKDRVNSNCNRVQAQILNFKSSKLLWMNAYLPCDPHTVDFDDQELNEVLNEIERILDTASYDDGLICADMNWDMSRTTGFAMTVRRFIDRLNLCSLWEHHTVDFTHVHTDLKSLSTIDHFICNERLLPFVAGAGPLHSGDNPSRHSPIMVKLKMGELPVKVKCEAERVRRPYWYKANIDNCEAFKNTLNMKIEALAVPDSLQCQNVHCNSEAHSEARDGFVLDLLGSVIESTHATIPMVGGRAGAARPESGGVPGWREAVAPYRKDSLFWHSVWLSAGRPNTGQLFEIMKRTRNQFHHAMRKVRKAAEKIKRQRLFEAALLGGGDLIKELKKLKGGKNSQELPENVAGANGPDEVCQKFKDVYSDLYNSADISQEMEGIKADIESKVCQENIIEVNKITTESVKTAAHMMKKGKCDVSGSYTTDAIRNAPDSFYKQMAAVYRSWLIHGTVSRPLLACAFLPLLKSSLKDPAETKSYRAIAGSATMLMLFDRLVLYLLYLLYLL